MKRLLTDRQLKEVLGGCSDLTLWWLRRDGKLPKPKKLGKRNVTPPSLRFLDHEPGLRAARSTNPLYGAQVRPRLSAMSMVSETVISGVRARIRSCDLRVMSSDMR